MGAKRRPEMYVERMMDLGRILDKKSCFLFGPRQCGKSWLVRHSLEGAKVFDLLRAETYNRLAVHPEYLGEVARDGDVAVIDEIQKLPHLLDEVHRLIEDRGMRFLLTGSSARRLRGKGVNLLGGRARMRTLHPFSAVELGDGFDLERALNDGLIPGIWFSDEPEEDLAGYAGLYLEQEIAQEGATRNLPAFSRFLEVAAACSGELVNHTKVSDDAQVPRSTVQEYFRILKETLMAREVPVWKRGDRRKTVETSKWYLFDTGVLRRLQRRGRLARGTPEYGAAFEHWVLHELATWADARGGDAEIAHWRTRTHLEVDFVVNGEVAIEAKASAVLRKEHLKGLRAIGEEGTFAHRVVVSLEEEERRVEGIEVLPYRVFVERLWGGELLG